MVEFAHPALLWALPAAALPVLIHLLNRRRYRRVPWAAMAHLLTAEHRSRAYRYHNLGRLESLGFYDFELLSSNLRLTDLQGALLNSQLEKFPQQMARRMENYAFLSAELRKIGGVDPLPADDRITRHGFYYYIFKYDAAQFGGVHREKFREALAAEGLNVTRAYGRSINEYPLFRNMKVPAEYTKSQYASVRMPVSEDACANRICTFSHTMLLLDRPALTKVVEAIAKVKANIGELK